MKKLTREEVMRKNLPPGMIPAAKTYMRIIGDGFSPMFALAVALHELDAASKTRTRKVKHGESHD